MAYEVLAIRTALEYDRRHRLPGAGTMTPLENAPNNTARTFQDALVCRRRRSRASRLVASPEMLEIGSLPRGGQQHVRSRLK